ncbi:MAG TPA: hypothetical protein EYP92_03650 [Candidatus Thioglobus sp.]|jgi:hypothetical protein|nr:hypothetical protein [Candidatus Thioglobus sp.]
MSRLLAVDIITNDLKELEANLKKQVKTMFSESEWDDSHSYLIEKDYRAWDVMMGAKKCKFGTYKHSSSTRRCLDNSRHFNVISKNNKKEKVVL